MSAAWTICRKEWRVMLDTPLGYVVATAFLLASGFFFGKNLFLFGEAEMRGYFGVLPMLLLFFVPAMSMRMLADEQHDGSYELLATLPVSTWSIVLGKYLAVSGQLLALLLATLLYPFSLAMLGHIDAGQIAASYLATLLLVSCYVSVSLYASALTSRAVIAYVLGFGLLLGVFLLGESIATLPPLWQDWLVLLSPLSHYERMLRGVIGLEDLVLLLAWSAIFLTLCWFQLERRRWQ